MRRKRVKSRLLACMLSAALAISLLPAAALADTTDDSAESTEAVTQTFTQTETVSPDDDQDFDSYWIDVVFTTTDGALTNIELTSEWGIKADQNLRYSTNALGGIAYELLNAETITYELDTISGATCTSGSLLHAIKEAIEEASESDDFTWTSVSADLTATINGEAVEIGIKELTDDEDDDDSSNSENSGSGSGQGNKSQNSFEFEEGEGVTYTNLSSVDNVVQVQFTIPDGYTATGINLIRVGNSAYMVMKDPETFATMFSFDADTCILTIYRDNLTSYALTVSLTLTDADGTSGNTNISVTVLEGDSTITLADKTVDYTGSAIEMDGAVVTGSTGEVTYAYYADAELTTQLAGAPTEAGTYYVTATVADDDTCYGATSAAAVLTINAVVSEEDGQNGGTTGDNTVTTEKQAQKITIKKSSFKKTFKASKLKKSKKTFKLKATTSGDGKITYTKQSGNKKIKVSKTGKVTVKKGLKKGTYKVKVKIKAAATGTCTEKTVTKTITIKVK